MREKKVISNIATNIMLQVFLALSGLLIPRFIMIYYGSAMNGMISAISQFITCASLVELGIVNAANLTLYRPIACNDFDTINDIVSSVKRTYIKSGIFYLGIIMILAGLYSDMLKSQFEQDFVFSMFICIGLVNAVDYFFVGKYKVLLTADQRYYVLNIVKIFATILLIFVSLTMLINQYPLLLVKSMPVLTRFLEVLLLKIYVNKRYRGLSFCSDKTYKIYQRGSTFVHQLCITIVYNTDLIVLSVLLPESSLLEISVYTVYSLALSMINNLMGAFTTGINATLGNMYVKNEKKKFEDVFNLYEYLYFIILFITYTCFGLLIINFVSCYTAGVNDTNYIRWEVGILFMLIGFSAQIKDVSLVVITAVGHYKQTQNHIICEAVINIVLSIILVNKYGLDGVLIGTLAAHLFMDYKTIKYAGKVLLQGTIQRTIKRIIRNGIVSAVILSIGIYFYEITTEWYKWIGHAGISVLICIFIFVGTNSLCEMQNIKKIKNILFKK